MGLHRACVLLVAACRAHLWSPHVTSAAARAHHVTGPLPPGNTASHVHPAARRGRSRGTSLLAPASAPPPPLVLHCHSARRGESPRAVPPRWWAAAGWARRRLREADALRLGGDVSGASLLAHVAALAPRALTPVYPVRLRGQGHCRRMASQLLWRIGGNDSAPRSPHRAR